MIYAYIAKLVQQAKEAELIEAADVIYVRNQVIQLFKLEAFPEESAVEKLSDDLSIHDVIDWLVSYATDQAIIENLLDMKDIFAANLMNCFVARPSAVRETFYDKYKQAPTAATAYFYQLSKNSNYIQMNRIKNNISYKIDTAYGVMDITINLSKPEKDPEEIKRERAMKKDVHYPKCLLCKENEGYAGRIGHPARSNHRIIPIELAGETWNLQYSPYVYYNEHSIVFSDEHRDMKIDRQAFERLLHFTEKFPHYFIGSNADLPIVGGSILSHDHYQGGCYEFAMTRAEDSFQFPLNNFPDVTASVLKWPMSVIRLRGKSSIELVNAGELILKSWRGYSDKAAHIHAFTEDVPHNTITPIARVRNGSFELDLVLRNNRTTAEHPLGIFHPHADVHHIKKENIGLIEVMGLAVLPPRLKEELGEITKLLLGKENTVKDYHQQWADAIVQEYGIISTVSEAEQIVKKELGKKFVRVLEDAGVFKEKQSFQRFLDILN
ncbi:UDP-glucose--hexose-1-phosphate uridylyltransferase [Niallia sp. BSM11]|uniref:UDP-glucose--hexose-1-phosphate uridylyltransferase n=1 Tax=Niallia sp. BSM11 TaxID=3391576 RepID=UPI00398506A2